MHNFGFFRYLELQLRGNYKFQVALGYWLGIILKGDTAHMAVDIQSKEFISTNYNVCTINFRSISRYLEKYLERLQWLRNSKHVTAENVVKLRSEMQLLKRSVEEKWMSTAIDWMNSRKETCPQSHVSLLYIYPASHKIDYV